MTQIDIQSSCFILSDAKAQNNVVTADKICLMTSLVNGPKVLKIEFPFILKFEKLLNQPKVDLEVAFFKLEIEIKLFGIISSMIKSNTVTNQNSAIALQNMNSSDRSRSNIWGYYMDMALYRPYDMVHMIWSYDSTEYDVF